VTTVVIPLCHGSGGRGGGSGGGLESAADHRLNAAHWAGATGETLNMLLANRELDKIGDRSVAEARNNPVIAGMINTHVVDLVGEVGPQLRVLTDDGDDDGDYAHEVEAAWEAW